MRALHVATDEEVLRYGRARAWPPMAGGSPDAHANFAYSTIAALSGGGGTPTTYTSVTVQTGDGALFPAVPFNAVACPPGVAPLSTNAEIVRVTANAANVLTVTRAQEGTTAKNLAVGWQIFAGFTAKTLTDVEAAPTGSSHTAGILNVVSGVNTVANLLYFVRLPIRNACTITGVMFAVATTGGNVMSALYNAGGTSKLAASASTAVAAGLTVQHLAFTGTVAVTPGDYILAVVFSTATSVIDFAVPCSPSNSAAQGSFSTPATVTPPPVTTSVSMPLMATY